MTNYKIASPLFIVREDCKKDLFTVLEKLKSLGFDGVEFLGFYGHSPQAIKEKLDELSLLALGNHVDYATFAASTDKVIAEHQTLGCRYLTVTGPPQEALSDRAKLKDYIAKVTRIGKDCREAGITLLYHNHALELKQRIDETVMLDYLLDRIPAESLALEPDLGWMEIGGGDPGAYLEKYRKRCPIIHFKDYYALNPKDIGTVSGDDLERGGQDNSFFEFRPTGYGIVNTPALFPKALDCCPEWFVADHDMAYERDSYDDLKLSLDYLRTLLRLHDRQSL